MAADFRVTIRGPDWEVVAEASKKDRIHHALHGALQMASAWGITRIYELLASTAVELSSSGVDNCSRSSRGVRYMRSSNTDRIGVAEQEFLKAALAVVKAWEANDG